MKSNFEFLNRYWPMLARIGETAENYLYSDPNGSVQSRYPAVSVRNLMTP